jgi:hypothetical protein
MFARWRNLAAAAGAIWFPFASAQASPDRNDLRYDAPCTRGRACADYQDCAASNPWQTYDRKSWFQQYYRNSLNDPASISDQPENSPSFESEYTTGNDDSSSGQSVTDFNEPEISTADRSGVILEPRIEEAIDCDGRCDDSTCPCHDIIDLDSDEPNLPTNSSFNERFCPADHSHPGCFDIFETYSFEAESASESSSATTPKAVLSGTIEPIFEACDEEALDDSFEQFPESTIESRNILDDSDSTSLEEGAGDAEEESQDAIDDFGYYSADQAPRFHMFYPGCEWSPYEPIECGRGQAVKTLDQVDSSSPANDSQQLTLEVD